MQFEIKTQKKTKYPRGSYSVITGRSGLSAAKYAEIKTLTMAGWVMFHPLLPKLSGISSFMKTMTEKQKQKQTLFPCRVIRLIYENLTAELPLCPRPADLLENH